MFMLIYTQHSSQIHLRLCSKRCNQRMICAVSLGEAAAALCSAYGQAYALKAIDQTYNTNVC